MRVCIRTIKWGETVFSDCNWVKTIFIVSVV
jgi:hypothetical protein